MRRWIWLGVVLCAACGGDAGPTAPPPVVRAQVDPIPGTGSFVNCIFGSCYFRGEARNVGQGCAGQVRGVVRLYDEAGTQLASGQWTLGSRVVRPGESFLYTTLESFTDERLARYATEPSWSDVPC